MAARLPSFAEGIGRALSRGAAADRGRVVVDSRGTGCGASRFAVVERDDARRFAELERRAITVLRLLGQQQRHDLGQLRVATRGSSSSPAGFSVSTADDIRPQSRAMRAAGRRLERPRGES